MLSVIDGHNDTLTRIFAEGGGGNDAFLNGQDEGHLDLPKAMAGGYSAGLFAIYIRSLVKIPKNEPPRGDDGSWTFTPPSIEHDWALSETTRLLGCLDELLAAAPDKIRLCIDIDDVQASVDGHHLGIILHIEGCEMISSDLSELNELHARGLRSLGPVWSRANVFGTGIRFGWPSSNDIGPGLTDAGKGLVAACNELGIMVDLSHLNRAGFLDVAAISTKPLVATHCGCHALCESARNLDDEQLRIIASTDGVIGCNFFTGDLRGDGRFEPDMPLTRMAEHIEHIVEVCGINHVALGSDFDGATMCDELCDSSKLPYLIELLRSRGWSDRDLILLAHGNWMRVLDATWG
ncbi:MAG: membrane dipeptidase [Phycisphaerae bacterium]|nr:membrane dipeptidase [Phycisphaerae bacterium]